MDLVQAFKEAGKLPQSQLADRAVELASLNPIVSKDTSQLVAVVLSHCATAFEAGRIYERGIQEGQ